MNSEQTPSTIKQIMGQAIAEKARKFTYCLIIDDKTIGTAISIKLGEHYFLATASHVIENANDIKLITHNQIANCVTDILAKHCDSRNDLSLLEISSSDSEYFDDFLSFDCLYITNEDEKLNPALVVGYPCKFCNTVKEVVLSKNSIVKLTRCDSVSFHTNTLPCSKWPCDGLPNEDGNYKQLVIGRDILLDFRPKPEIKPFTSQTAGTANPAIKCSPLNPHGMSGGGIWLPQSTEGKEKITYSKTCLIGIQLSWYPDRNLLRGIRIGAWLDFVKKIYPNIIC